jgi:hypothetical protein
MSSKMTSLYYKVYTPNKNFVLYDPEKKYADILKKNYGFRLFKILRDGTSGYIVPLRHEQTLKDIIAKFAPKPPTPEKVVENDRMDEMAKHAKHRQDQQKYRRAKSKSKEPEPVPEPVNEPEPVDLKYYKKYTKYIKTPENSITSLESSDDDRSSLGDSPIRRSPVRNERDRRSPVRNERDRRSPVRNERDRYDRRSPVRNERDRYDRRSPVRNERDRYDRRSPVRNERPRYDERDRYDRYKSPPRDIKAEMKYLQDRLRRMEEKLM